MTLEKQLRKDILTLTGEKPKRNQTRIGMKYKKNKDTTQTPPNSNENKTEPIKVESVNPNPTPQIQTTNNPFEKFKKEWDATKEGKSDPAGTTPAGNSNENTTTPVKIENKPPQPAVEITGETLLLLVNTVFPILAVVGVRIFTRNKKKVSLSGMKLTDEEKTSLEELADACAAEILGLLKPIHLFAITLGSIYMGKIIANIEDNEKYVPKQKKNKNETKK